MRAISVFSRETGTSTRWCLAAAALRRRVRKSAMGSVCIVLLPAGFHDAGDLALQRHTAKTDSAHLELADIVAHAWKPYVAQAVQEFVHLVAAQGRRAPDGHALANLEVRNGFLRARDDGLLPGDLTQLHSGGVQQFGVLAGLAETDVDGYLLHSRHRHDILPAKALHQRGHR